jgi:putative hydrolase of the HAD superfamily
MTIAVDLIGLDGDDTLWHNEAYFRLSEARFAALLEPWTDAGQLSARLLSVERSNMDHYGYGAKAFVLSMIETALEITEHKVSGEVIAELLRLGKQILTQPVELLDGVETTVPRLATLAPLVLITKGDLLHQEAKVAGSGLGDHFTGVEIVSEKDPETYARAIAPYGVRAGRFVMIGNSVRSDVLPVLALGGAAIHVPGQYGWAHEEADLPNDPTRCRRVARFTDVPMCLRQLRGVGVATT